MKLWKEILKQSTNKHDHVPTYIHTHAHVTKPSQKFLVETHELHSEGQQVAAEFDNIG